MMYHRTISFSINKFSFIPSRLANINSIRRFSSTIPFKPCIISEKKIESSYKDKEEINPIFSTNANYSSLVKNEKLLKVLNKNYYTKATNIQAKSYSSIYYGRELFIGAETGSGKTFSFLIPLIDRLMTLTYSNKEGINDKEIELLNDLKEKNSNDLHLFQLGNSSKNHNDNIQIGVILTPTSDLTDQIINMSSKIAEDLKAEDFHLDLFSRVDHLCDAVLREESGGRSPEIRELNHDENDLVDPISHLISDTPPVKNSKIQSTSPLIPEPAMKTKNFILVCTPKKLSEYISSFTKPDMFNYLEDPLDSFNSFPLFLLNHLNFLVMDEADMLFDGGFKRDIELIFEKLLIFKRARMKSYNLPKHLRDLQYIFVGATLPNSGKKSIANLIKYEFPRINYVSTSSFHAHHPSINQTFYELDPSVVSGSKEHVLTVLNSLYSQVYPGKTISYNEDPSWINKLNNSTMIFFNEVQSINNFINSLKELNYINEDYSLYTEFHSGISKIERKNNLNNFRNNLTKILLCTDSCGRGIDLPNVSSIIQAEFALNVSQYLHRIGRCSRGGKKGFAYNFYFPYSKHLVPLITDVSKTDELDVSHDEIKKELNSGIIESAFSRKRGLRNKIKRKNSRQENKK